MPRKTHHCANPSAVAGANKLHEGLLAIGIWLGGSACRASLLGCALGGIAAWQVCALKAGATARCATGGGVTLFLWKSQGLGRAVVFVDGRTQ